MSKPLYYQIIKDAKDALATPPRCPSCHKKMRPYSAAGMIPAMEQIIDIITGNEMRFICLGMEKNPEYPAYQRKLQEYNKKMEERQKIIMENQQRMLFKKKVPPMPEKPKFISPQKPCKYNYKFGYRDGRIVKKGADRPVWFVDDTGNLKRYSVIPF